jgi:DHA3 family macrolide efflux protein-like MFS transporter
MARESSPYAAMATGSSLLAAMSNRDFQLLFFGQLVSQVGDLFLFIAALSLINRLTESPLALSGLALAISIPQLTFGLLGGVLVDRFNRKQLLIVSDVLRALVILPAVLVHQRSEVWILYPAAAGLAIVGTAFYPARNASIPNIVSPMLLLSANTLIQVSYILALVFGATLAGFVVNLWGPTAAILFDSGSFLFSALLIAVMHIPPNIPAQTHGAARTVWEQLVQGLRYVTGSSVLLRVLAITAIAALGIGAIQILGLNFLNQRLNVSVQGFGLTMAMMGIGIAVGGAVVQRFASRRPANQVVGLCLAGVGVAIIVFALAPNFGFVLVAAAAIGLCLVVARAGLATLTQQLVPDQVRGRVESAVNMVVSVSTASAQGLAGLLGDPHFLGVQGVFVSAGVITLMAGISSIYALRGAVQRIANVERRMTNVE